MVKSIINAEKALGTGLFQKISTHTTLDEVPKNFRISKKDISSLSRIPNPADSNSWGILQDFERSCWNSDQNSQNFRKIRGIPVRLTEHLLRISNVVHR